MSRRNVLLDPAVQAASRAAAELGRLRELLDGEYARRRIMRRLFGDPDDPSRDARHFFLMLADMAQMGALDIAEDDREETARAANRALVNRLIATWEGDEATLTKLRARERELTEEN